MRLLFVLPEFGPSARGGIGSFYGHLLPCLAAAGCKIEVCLVQPNRVLETRSSARGVTVFQVPRTLFEEEFIGLNHLAEVPGLRRSLAIAFAAHRFCKEISCDVVEVTDWGLLHVPWLLQPGGPPTVVQLHASNGQVSYHDAFIGEELAGLMTRLLEASILGRADELQTYGLQNANEWSALLNRGVEHIWPAWPVTPPNSAVPIEDSQPFGLVVGRVQCWKGPEVLCEALALLGAKSPKFRWVGRDHPYRCLDQSMSNYLAARYPSIWGSIVTHIGELDAEATAAMQSAASFVVVPSTWDVFNLTVIEAMTQSRVVICSDGAGAVDLIEHGVNGFSYPRNDHRNLAELIAAASVMSSKDRLEMGKRARQTIEDTLDPKRNVKQRINRYSKLAYRGRTLRIKHPWYDGLFRASSRGSELCFLDKFPLSEITKYALRRGFKRLSSI